MTLKEYESFDLAFFYFYFKSTPTEFMRVAPVFYSTSQDFPFPNIRSSIAKFIWRNILLKGTIQYQYIVPTSIVVKNGKDDLGFGDVDHVALSWKSTVDKLKAINNDKLPLAKVAHRMLLWLKLAVTKDQPFYSLKEEHLIQGIMGNIKTNSLTFFKDLKMRLLVLFVILLRKIAEEYEAFCTH